MRSCNQINCILSKEMAFLANKKNNEKAKRELLFRLENGEIFSAKGTSFFVLLQYQSLGRICVRYTAMWLWPLCFVLIPGNFLELLIDDLATERQTDSKSTHKTRDSRKTLKEIVFLRNTLVFTRRSGIKFGAGLPNHMFELEWKHVTFDDLNGYRLSFWATLTWVD